MNQETDYYTAAFEEMERSADGRRIGWLSDVRRSGIARFAALGFPTTGLEEWKNTDVAPIARLPFRLATRGADGLNASDLGDYSICEAECCQLVFVNGHYSERLSSLKDLPPNARVKSLAVALETDRRLVEPYLTHQAACGQNAFTALNTAFIADGAFVYLPPQTVLKGIIHLLFLSRNQEGPTVSHPRNLVVLAPESEATIVESYVGVRNGGYFTNAITDIFMGSHSIAEHYKLQRESEDAFHVAAVRVLQEQDAAFYSHSVSLGSSIVRNDINVVLEGKGGECLLNGLYLARGNQHVDNHTQIDHAGSNCRSRELYKGILDGRSGGVFNGRIIVRQKAQKTNAVQTNRNLLLSEGASISTEPQLEIYADDVKCTHGATIGRLDEDALFYLRSRGLAEDSARILLTYAFASDILNAMKVKPIQCQIDLVLLKRLAGVARAA